MDNSLLLKGLVVLLTLPWWLPIVRVVVREVWRVSDPGERANAYGRSTSSAPADGDLFAYDALGWSPDKPEERRRVNTRWATGRKQVVRRPTRFRDAPR